MKSWVWNKYDSIFRSANTIVGIFGIGVRVRDRKQWMDVEMEICLRSLLPKVLEITRMVEREKTRVLLFNSMNLFKFWREA